MLNPPVIPNQTAQKPIIAAIQPEKSSVVDVDAAPPNFNKSHKPTFFCAISLNWTHLLDAEHSEYESIWTHSSKRSPMRIEEASKWYSAKCKGLVNECHSRTRLACCLPIEWVVKAFQVSLQGWQDVGHCSHVQSKNLRSWTDCSKSVRSNFGGNCYWEVWRGIWNNI